MPELMGVLNTTHEVLQKREMYDLKTVADLDLTDKHVQITPATWINDVTHGRRCYVGLTRRKRR